MIYGGDFSSRGTVEETVEDLQKVTNNPGQPIDFLYYRAWTMYNDDNLYGAIRDLLKKAYNASGATLWGAYGEVGYGPTSRPGEGQAANMWSLISSGGIEWQLPPWIAMEDEPAGYSNGVFQWVPRLGLFDYLDRKAMPFIHAIAEKMGKLPVVYTGPNWIKYYLAPAKGIAKYDDLFACPLAVARYMNFPDPSGVANPLISNTYNLTNLWAEWAFWQYFGDDTKVAGIPRLDRVIWPGDRGSLKSWARDYTAGIPPVAIPETKTFATVTSANLRLRHVPGLSGDVIAKMSKGASFEVLEAKEMDGYTWVRLDSGWIATGPGLAVLDERAA